MLQSLSDWLARDPGRLSASLEGFVGHPAYNTPQLRADLDRFAFLLGAQRSNSVFVPTALPCTPTCRYGAAMNAT
jgi:hypothetical protein